MVNPRDIRDGERTNEIAAAGHEVLEAVEDPDHLVALVDRLQRGGADRAVDAGSRAAAHQDPDAHAVSRHE